MPHGGSKTIQGFPAPGPDAGRWPGQGPSRAVAACPAPAVRGPAVPAGCASALSDGRDGRPARGPRPCGGAAAPARQGRFRPGAAARRRVKRLPGPVAAVAASGEVPCFSCQFSRRRCRWRCWPPSRGGWRSGRASRRCRCAWWVSSACASAAAASSSAGGPSAGPSYRSSVWRPAVPLPPGRRQSGPWHGCGRNPSQGPDGKLFLQTAGDLFLAQTRQRQVGQELAGRWRSVPSGRADGAGPPQGA